MEDKNMARVELNEQNLENVVGGAFNYFQRNGQTICKVDGVGAYYASPTAFGQIAAHAAADTSLTAQEVVDWAVANGYLSKNPY